MKIKVGDDIVDPDRMREFGQMMFPNPPDVEKAKVEMEVMLPRLTQNILDDHHGARLLYSEVVVGHPAHTPGPQPPVGWYVMIEEAE